jgi:hypothetical protein
MEPTTYYSVNREQVLAKTHQFVLCDCGQKVKRGCLSSHRTYSHRHRIWVQMTVSQEATGRPVAVAPLHNW